MNVITFQLLSLKVNRQLFRSIFWPYDKDQDIFENLPPFMISRETFINFLKQLFYLDFPHNESNVPIKLFYKQKIV